MFVFLSYLDRGPVGLMAPKLAKTSNRPMGESDVEGLAYIKASAAARASAAEEMRGRVDTVPDHPALFMLLTRILQM